MDLPRLGWGAILCHGPEPTGDGKGGVGLMPCMVGAEVGVWVPLCWVNTSKPYIAVLGESRSADEPMTWAYSLLLSLPGLLRGGLGRGALPETGWLRRLISGQCRAWESGVRLPVLPFSSSALQWHPLRPASTSIPRGGTRPRSWGASSTSSTSRTHARCWCRSKSWTGPRCSCKAAGTQLGSPGAWRPFSGLHREPLRGWDGGDTQHEAPH